MSLPAGVGARARGATGPGSSSGYEIAHRQPMNPCLCRSRRPRAPARRPLLQGPKCVQLIVLHSFTRPATPPITMLHTSSLLAGRRAACPARVLQRTARSAVRPRLQTPNSGELWATPAAAPARDVRPKAFNQATIKVRGPARSGDGAMERIRPGGRARGGGLASQRGRRTRDLSARVLRRARSAALHAAPTRSTPPPPPLPGRGRRRWRLQRRQPHEAGQPAGRRVLGRQHRRAGAARAQQRAPV